LDSATNASAALPLNPLLEKKKQIEEAIRRQETAGARLLGRWFVAVGQVQHPELTARMNEALEKSLKRPRDRRLFGLEPLSGASRALSSEVAEAELADVRAKIEQLRKREENLVRAVKKARRGADDARLILRGQVLKRWREREPEFAALLAESLGKYLRHPSEFAIVGLAVPEGWQPPAGSESEGGESAREPEGKAPPKGSPAWTASAAAKAAESKSNGVGAALPPPAVLASKAPATAAASTSGGAAGLPAPRIALGAKSAANPGKASSEGGAT
jgi:hypothetical protein